MDIRVKDQHMFWRERHLPLSKHKRGKCEHKPNYNNAVNNNNQIKSAWINANQSGFFSDNNVSTSKISFSANAIENLNKIVDNQKGFKFFDNIKKTVSKSVNKFFENLGKNKNIQNFFTFNDKTIKIFEKMGESQAWLESIIIFILSVALKPFLTMAVPGVKKEDKEYSVVKTMVGAVVDLFIATLTLLPIKKGFKNLSKNTQYLQKNSELLKDSKKFKQFSKIIEYIPKFTLIPAKAFITIALIEPTINFLFPEHKKEKNKEMEQSQNNEFNNFNTIQFFGDANKFMNAMEGGMNSDK